MKPLRILPQVHHQTRSIFVMAGLLVLYCLWLWVLIRWGWMEKDASGVRAASLLVVPLVPVSIVDLWMRSSWQQETPTLYPPPRLLEKLLYPEYGLFWFPVLIMIPMWVWGAGLMGWSVVLWLN